MQTYAIGPKTKLRL